MTVSSPLRALRLPLYLAVARIALRQRARERLLLATRVAFLGIMLLVFSRMWQAILPAGRAADNVWYLAITEWVTLSHPRLYLELERDVRSGDLVQQLGRPASYLGIKLAESLADLALSLLVLGLGGALFAYLLAGTLPADPRGLLLAVPLGVGASLLALSCNALIGLSAFWLLDCTPAYWIWQKATFVLGGLMVPLSLYPAWLRELALVTPFSALLHGPGSMVFGFAPALALSVACKLALWTLLSLALLALVYRRGVRALELHGG